MYDLRALLTLANVPLSNPRCKPLGVLTGKQDV
jgi:hypothetical protein